MPTNEVVDLDDWAMGIAEDAGYLDFDDDGAAPSPRLHIVTDDEALSLAAAAAPPRVSDDAHEQWLAYWAALWGRFDYDRPAYIGLSRNPFPGDGRFGLVGTYDVCDPEKAWAAIQKEETWVRAVHSNVGLLSNPIAKGRGKAKDVGYITALWVDVDIADCGAHAPTTDHRPHPTAEQARALVDSVPWKPGLVVHSGYGLHCYFLLNEPLDAQSVDATDLLARWDAYWTNVFNCADVHTSWMDEETGKSGTVRGFHIDKGVAGDLARVLRPAGSLNRKYRGDPKLVRIIVNDETRYGADDFSDALPDASAYRTSGENTAPISSSPTKPGTALLRNERARAGDWFARSDGALHAMLRLHGLIPTAHETDRWTYRRPNGTFGDESHAQVHHDPDGIDRIWPATGTRLQSDWEGVEGHVWSAWDILGHRHCEGDWPLAARIVRHWTTDGIVDISGLTDSIRNRSANELRVDYPQTVVGRQRSNGTETSVGEIFASLPCDDARGYALRWALLEGAQFLWSSTAVAVDVGDVVWRGWNGCVWHREARSGPTGMQASLNRVAAAIVDEEAPVRQDEAAKRATSAVLAGGGDKDAIRGAVADARALVQKQMRAYAAALTRTNGYKDAIAQITALSDSEREYLARFDPNIQPDRRVRTDVWNARPWLLALEGGLGVVDLRTGELRPYDPQDRLTTAVAAPFDGRDEWESVMRAGLETIAAGRRLVWPDYMQEMFGRWDLSATGLAEHLQRVAGMAVWGDQTGCIVLIHSPDATGTGKSTVFNALVRAMGTEMACDTTMEVFSGNDDPNAPKPAKARLVGRRFWWSDDSKSAQDNAGRRNTGFQVDSGDIKRITTPGARLAGARALHKPEEEEPVRGTLMASSQHLVSFTESDVALLRRLVVIVFNAASQIPADQLDDDKGAVWMTPGGLAWVLLWAIEGSVKSRREHARRKIELNNGAGVSFLDCLAAPPEAAEWKASYGEKINEASEFWNATYVAGATTDIVTPDDIRIAYEAWYMARWSLGGSQDRLKPNAPRMLSDQRLLMLCAQLVSAMGGRKTRHPVVGTDGKNTGQKVTVYEGVTPMDSRQKSERKEAARRAERPCTVKLEGGRISRGVCSTEGCEAACGRGEHRDGAHQCAPHEARGKADAQGEQDARAAATRVPIRPIPLDDDDDF